MIVNTPNTDLLGLTQTSKRKFRVSLAKLFILFGAFIINGLSLRAIASEPLSVDHEKITLWSQGVRLAGDIYKPKSLSSTDKLPGILLIPGWGGSKNNVGKNYARHFANAGFLVLTFDFKSWGESDGPLLASDKLAAIEEAQESTLKASHIRNIINPISMLADVRAALYYLGAEPQVMANNLGVWGTSMGGGLALAIAASDGRVKALVDQMGPVNYQYNLRKMPEEVIRYAEAQAARGEIPPYPGPDSKLNPDLQGYVDWVAMKRFNPLSQIENLQAPTLIIDAENETLFETEKNGQLLYRAIKNRLPARYKLYPGGHYAMYSGDNLRAAREEALRWFSLYLKKEVTLE